MDEQTPHLHVTVVPILTTERKKKASEAKARKRYRTKSGNAPRLSADSIMTCENLTHFQDTYAEAMERFGLERGIRGSEARHVDQHEYYRQCQIKKKDLEQDVATLATEKEQLDTEIQSLEKRRAELERGNRWIEKTIIESKAAKAVLSLAKIVGIERLFSFTAKINAPSERVMQKIGMVKAGEFRHPNLSDDSPLRVHVLYKIDL